MKGVIICGGKGTRMGKINVPKSLLEIGGKPLIQHQIEWFEHYGVREILVLAGHLSKQIDHFVNTHPFRANIIVQKESFPLGTAGALKSAEQFLDNTFIVIYGDKMHNICLDRMIAYHLNKPSICTIGVHPTTHMHDSDLLDMDDNCKITEVHPKPHDEAKDYRNLTNVCIYIMIPRVLSYIKPGVFSDFAKDVLPTLVKKERVFGYPTLEYMRDIGTPERLKEVQHDWESGKIVNCRTKRKAIFLDRDGVIIQRRDRQHGDGHDKTPDEFELFPDTISAINMINRSSYLAIVITNQPGIAKGFFTMDGLRSINNRMETLLGKGAAKLDAIFVCPHHPEKGFPGENPLYKIDCECRKPKPGLILQAAEQFNIDLSQSYMVGDTWRDIECGKAANVKTIALLQGDSNWKESKADVTFDNLTDAIHYIIGKEGETGENVTQV
jgi:histidinol-phosphate phosphatase family protein